MPGHPPGPSPTGPPAVAMPSPRGVRVREPPPRDRVGSLAHAGQCSSARQTGQIIGAGGDPIGRDRLG